MPSSYNPPGGGGGGGPSAPQLPAWTYTSGAIGTGQFTTDNAAIGSTSAITITDSLGGFSLGLWSMLPPSSMLFLTDSSGLVSVFQVGSAGEPSGGVVAITVTAKVAGTSDWSGQYTFSFRPSIQTAADIGLGNVTNDAQVKVSDIGTTVLAPNGDGSALTNLNASVITGRIDGSRNVLGDGAGGGAGTDSIRWAERSLRDGNGFAVLAWDGSYSGSGAPYQFDSNHLLRGDGSMLTNLTVGNIAAGGTLPAFNAAALTNLTGANIVGPLPSAVADGTYTVGIGGTQNGTITLVNGVITTIQQAS